MFNILFLISLFFAFPVFAVEPTEYTIPTTSINISVEQSLATIQENRNKLNDLLAKKDQTKREIDVSQAYLTELNTQIADVRAVIATHKKNILDIASLATAPTKAKTICNTKEGICDGWVPR
jgi:uncharacterized coiled-coil DUF342 family protein